MSRALALAAATLASVACQQTLHLYESDGGATAAAGRNGGGSGGGAGVAGADAGGADSRCSGSANVLTFTPDSPQVVVALDRSSSMSQTFPGSSDTHLSAALYALYSEVSTYAMPKFNRPWTVHFSFVDFPDMGNGCTGTGECCAKDATALTTASFDMTTACESPAQAPPASCVVTSKRPIEAALDKADQALSNSTANGPRFVLLISDGDPQGGCTSDDCISAQRSVNTLGSDHITLEVAAIDGGGSTSCLQDLAMTANGTTHSPSYAAASDSNSLGSVIAEAVSATVCSGTLTNAQGSSSSLQVSMVFGTSTTIYGNSPTDGWTYDQNFNRLRLHGSLCEAYTQNPGGLFIETGCPSQSGGRP